MGKMHSEIQMRIYNFLKKYGSRIAIIIFIWIIILIINSYIKKHSTEELFSSYSPDSPIIADTDSMSDNRAKKNRELVEQYFTYCDNGDYENAYNMLSSDCKEVIYQNDISKFKEYIDYIFNGKTNSKIYNLQNYSNKNGKYIYDITIFDDIVSTGNADNYDKFEDKIVILKQDKEYKISNQGYIGKTSKDKSFEDTSVKIEYTELNESYTKKSYTFKFTNKTDKQMVISTGFGEEEITVTLSDGTKRKFANQDDGPFTVEPGETKEIYVVFNVFYDEDNQPEEINFNTVYFLENYEQGQALDGEGAISYNFDVTNSK